jgi:hypothetical protein
MLLELSASGTEYARADTAMLKVSVTGVGSTKRLLAGNGTRSSSASGTRPGRRSGGGDVELDEGGIYTSLDVFDVEEPPPPKRKRRTGQSATPGQRSASSTRAGSAGARRGGSPPPA